MKDWIRRICASANGWSKKRQLSLTVLLICTGLCVTAVLAGCEGASCATPKCGSSEVEGGKLSEVSLPGCGGCITPKGGCGTVFWPYMCTFVNGTFEEDPVPGKILACDISYLSRCAAEKDSCYFGHYAISNDDTDDSGWFYGSTGSLSQIS